MHLHEGLTHIQSQKKPWLLFGKSFTLKADFLTWAASFSLWIKYFDTYGETVYSNLGPLHHQ